MRGTDAGRRWILYLEETVSGECPSPLAPLGEWREAPGEGRRSPTHPAFIKASALVDHSGRK